VLHTQDCIAARAAVRVRDAGGGRQVVLRTVHHVDDFTTPALVDCQRQAIVEPDRVLVVSRWWRDRLLDEYGVEADVVPNGVDSARFAGVRPARRAALRGGAGIEPERFLFLAVGGIEPRKGSVHLLGALAELKPLVQPSPVVVVVGGHSFQDYADYREAALASLPGLGLELGRDVVLLGTVADADLPAWYAAADALAFPSLKEGWGLAVLEAQSAGLPVVATDLPVFREYLTDGRDALLVPPADTYELAKAMRRVVEDDALRQRLVDGGREVARRFTWEASARRHLEIYAGLSP
jgi:glycosyltransferase-like protein